MQINVTKVNFNNLTLTRDHIQSQEPQSQRQATSATPGLGKWVWERRVPSTLTATVARVM